MPRGGQNRASGAVQRRYFELIRQGLKGCGSGAPRRRVNQLRVAVVPRRWRDDRHRSPAYVLLLIVGAKMSSAIASLVERVSRYLILIHLPHGYKAPQPRDALIE